MDGIIGGERPDKIREEGENNYSLIRVACLEALAILGGNEDKFKTSFKWVYADFMLDGRHLEEFV